MEYLTMKDINNGKGFLSYEMRDILKERQLKDDNIIVNFAYTDYGGAFFDRIAVEYLIKNYPDNVLYESTVYYGKNLVLYGSIAVKFKEESEGYLLAFDGIEDYFFEREYQIKNECINEILNEYLYENEEGNKVNIDDEVKQYFNNYLYDNYSFNVLSSGYCDYCESDVHDLIESYLNSDELKMLLSKNREQKTNAQYYDIIK